MITFEVENLVHLVAVLQWSEAVPKMPEGAYGDHVIDPDFLQEARMNALWTANLVTPIDENKIVDVFMKEGVPTIEYMNLDDTIRHGKIVRIGDIY